MISLVLSLSLLILPSTCSNKPLNPSGKFFSFQLFIQYISAPEFVWFFFRVFYFFIDISVLPTNHFLDFLHSSFSSFITLKTIALKPLSHTSAVKSFSGTDFVELLLLFFL